LVQARAWLDAYFAGLRPDIDALPLAPQGSAFRQAVWALLRAIPYGETTTYGDLARALAAQSGQTKVSAQAVGGAVGHNPLSIVVPCHRVLGRDGSLTGYAGGLDNKVKLLTLEGVDAAHWRVPKRGSAL
jgi:methylated-DNA-[protein]-cysteine S-methyltransferase